VSGLPVARSLAINYTFDDKIYTNKYQNEYLFGDNLLVAPVSCNQLSAKVYLPEGEWYRFSSGEKFPGKSEVLVDAPLTDLPVFVRAGSFIPMQSVIQFTDQAPDPVLEVHLYAGLQGTSYVYYEDDGKTYDFEKGIFYKRTFVFDPGGKSVRFTAAEGSFSTRFTTVRMILHGFSAVKSITVGGKAVSVKEKSAREVSVEFPWIKDEIRITY
jgi:alpha-glucosidase